MYINYDSLEQSFAGLRGKIGPTTTIEEIERAFPKSAGRKMTTPEVRQMMSLLDQYKKGKDLSGLDKWFVPGTPFGIEHCPRHAAFFSSGLDYKERVFMAANRCGKTIAGAYEMACHATGLYPDWWVGRKFDHPVSCWAVGQSHQTTRDIVQKELMGTAGQYGTGMLPANTIIRTVAKSGVAGGLDLVYVKHVTGGTSVIGFKAYDQDQKSFVGTAQHVVWLDEEAPELIYNECLVRTVTTNGIVYITFTPLLGYTPLIIALAKDADYLAGAKPLTIIGDEEEEEEIYEMEPE